MKRTLAIVAILFLFRFDLPAQERPAPMPSRFEIYYEHGWGGPVGSTVYTEEYDAFDSAKKVRRYDAQGGQIQYQAELSDNERKAIYDAIRQNTLLAVKNEFTYPVTMVSPNIVGRLRIEIDGDIKEIRFKSAYGRVVTGDTEWTRLRNVLDVIENMLKAKDQKQTLPRHKAYA